MKTNHIIILCLLVLLASCDSNRFDKAENATGGKANEAQAITVDTPPSIDSNNDTKVKAPTSSSAAVETGKDSVHKFVRTADIKFRTKDVIKTTYDIEDITSHFGGFVTYTNLTGHVDETSYTPISEDSVLEVAHITTLNNMTLRIPNTRLDSALKAIAPLVDFMDYRLIKADDVALKLKSNQLETKRNEDYNAAVSSDKKSAKLSKTTLDAQQSVLEKQQAADEAKLANMDLEDKIKLSTVTLEIYQRQEIRQTKLLASKPLKPYEPPLYKKLGEALKDGWQLLEGLLLIMVRVWPFSLLLIGILFAYFWRLKDRNE